MAEKKEIREEVKAPVRIIEHGTAIVVGVVLLILGLGMGVSIVLLPFGIVVGIAGASLLLWGLFGKSRS
jgi:hypothetical protein